MDINGRRIGRNYSPLVIAEIGINHKGNFNLAKEMVLAAKKSGCECVKFQCHIIEDEMSPLAKQTVPGNESRSIWDIMSECQLNEEEEVALKKYTESLGMIYLSTPFSRDAADRLERMGVHAYKIGSGECNNFPLIRHIAKFGKPIILSTGMNNFDTIHKAVNIIREYNCEVALLHCTSIYPTPYNMIRLNAITEMRTEFPGVEVGISDHSLSPYPSIAAVALGAAIIERHFTSDKNIEGPDISISMDPVELSQIIEASKIVWMARDGSKGILDEEKVTIDFAYSTVVAIQDIEEGELLTYDNVWVKRPGIGEIKAEAFDDLVGKKASKRIRKNEHLRWDQIDY